MRLSPCIHSSMRSRHVIEVLFVATTLVACKNESEKRFTSLPSSQTGISFVNENLETEQNNVFLYEYYYNGGGVAAGDINNDGLVDLYFTSNTGDNKLYLNKGNLRFEDISASSNTRAASGWKTGATMVDINSDGLLDICVSRSGPNPPYARMNLLFINNGDLTFREAAFSAKLNDASYTTQTAFFDYDRDGDLDAFILNHSLLDISNSFDISKRNSRKRHPDVGNKLLRNDNGKFVDVSDTLGIYGPASNYGLGVSLSDINNDGWVDIYAGSDYTGRDRLLLNDSGKFFVDATDSLLSHISKFTMGTDIADVNNDGFMDIYTADMLPEDNFRQKQLQGADRYDEYTAMAKNGLHRQVMRNMLHINNGNGTFSEVGQMLGVSNTDWSWATLFADFDNDGYQDLLVTNGFKRDLTNNDFAKFQAFNEFREARKKGEKTTFLDMLNKFDENKIANYIFRGRPDSAYQNVTKEWGMDEPSLSNGALYADLDNDGDLDIVVNNLNSAASVYRNNSDKIRKQNFLKVKLSGGGQNLFAVGSRVEVYAEGKVQVREQLPVRGFQSSVDPVLHFGMGTAEHIDSLVIRWPEGERQVVRNAKVNQSLSVAKDERTSTAGIPSVETLFYEATENPGLIHKENEFIDFKVQPLLPRMYSREGPAFASADVNGDGFPDYYVGGAAGYSGQLLMSDRKGGHDKTNPESFAQDRMAEDVDATFFDADGDGDKDLYVVAGGYEHTEINDLADKLYINNGRGTFTKRILTVDAFSGACVRAADVEGDGDLDLFVGARIKPGSYPRPPESMLLINDGDGSFSAGADFSLKGMVTDACWTDLNDDRKPDLLVVGEWMPVTVLLNENGRLVDRTSTFISGRTEGWWSSIVAADFDNDGDEDFVAGNFGTNSQLKASEKQPVFLVYDDFDQNGSVDPILQYFVQGQPWPYPSRDELVEQLPSFRKRFTNYRSYSGASLEQVLTNDELRKAERLNAFRLTTSFIRNDNGKLVMVPMPSAMQRSPVMALATMDLNRDGYPDVISGGGISNGRARTGPMVGNSGFVFLSNGKGGFQFVPPHVAGIAVPGDVRHIHIENEKVIFVLNGGSSISYVLSMVED